MKDVFLFPPEEERDLLILGFFWFICLKGFTHRVVLDLGETLSRHASLDCLLSPTEALERVKAQSADVGLRRKPDSPDGGFLEADGPISQNHLARETPRKRWCIIKQEGRKNI